MYDYETEKEKIFSEEGQRMFLEIRDRIHRLLKESGAINMQCAIRGTTGSSWQMMACVDRLVEIGEIEEIPRQPKHLGHYRVFVKKREPECASEIHAICEQEENERQLHVCHLIASKNKLLETLIYAYSWLKSGIVQEAIQYEEDSEKVLPKIKAVIDEMS